MSQIASYEELSIYGEKEAGESKHNCVSNVISSLR